MDPFWSGLYRMLFKFEVIRASDNEYAVLIFAVGCAAVGLLAVLGDLSLFAIRGESLLNLKHSWRTTPIFVIAWAVGAFIFGYIGQMVNIFQVSLLACATVGMTWPLVFSRILERARKQEAEEQPTQEEQA